MNRRPVFDAVRKILGRGFTQEEVRRIDRALDVAVADRELGPVVRLGSLSERFESGGRGPGSVSSGSGDPGGVSYGTYQLATRAGTVASFVRAEGARWRDEFGTAKPGTSAFSRIWRTIADREPQDFGDAQHAFIERTHYRPAVAAVLRETGLDLDVRHDAVRNASWSVAVQHGGAVRILVPAVRQSDENALRDDHSYDRRLIEAIYSHRTAYVLRVAARSSPGAGRTLRSVVENRYPAERESALAMLEQATQEQ